VFVLYITGLISHGIIKDDDDDETTCFINVIFYQLYKLLLNYTFPSLPLTLRPNVDKGKPHTRSTKYLRIQASSPDAADTSLNVTKLQQNIIVCDIYTLIINVLVMHKMLKRMNFQSSRGYSISH